MTLLDRENIIAVLRYRIQAVTEAVNAGKIVTIPAENMTIGSWPGTGYMVIDPETGAGAYMISGGLNGGALSALLTLGGLCATFPSAAATSMLVWAAVQFFALTLISRYLLIRKRLYL